MSKRPPKLCGYCEAELTSRRRTYCDDQCRKARFLVASANGRVTLSRSEYEQVAKFGRPIVRILPPKVRTAKGLSRKQRDGEIIESSTVSGGCPLPKRSTIDVQFEQDGEYQGARTVIVTEAERQPDGDWLIRLERTGEHRPIPADDRNHFLASGAGYTTSGADSIDPDAPALDSAEADRINRDIQLGREELAERQITQLLKDVDQIDVPAEWSEAKRRKILKARELLGELAA